MRPALLQVIWRPSVSLREHCRLNRPFRPPHHLQQKEVGAWIGVVVESELEEAVAENVEVETEEEGPHAESSNNASW